MMLEHAPWFLSAWVFCNQAGVPVPIIPALIGAGALAGNGHLSMALIVGSAIGASLAADVLWYGLGWWRGERALRMLRRLSPRTGLLVHRARHVFSAHLWAFQLGARFVPELNAIAGGLAGTTRASITRFVCFGAASAAVWAAGWIGLGYLLSQTIEETAVRLGVRLIVLFVAAFAFYLPFRRGRRHGLIRVVRRAELRRDYLSGRQLGDRMVALDASGLEGTGASAPRCASEDRGRDDGDRQERGPSMSAPRARARREEAA
jgi:membrane protein DedA with SNARE-associated domain